MRDWGYIQREERRRMQVFLAKVYLEIFDYEIIVQVVAVLFVLS